MIFCRPKLQRFCLSIRKSVRLPLRKYHVPTNWQTCRCGGKFLWCFVFAIGSYVYVYIKNRTRKQTRKREKRHFVLEGNIIWRHKGNTATHCVIFKSYRADKVKHQVLTLNTSQKKSLKHPRDPRDSHDSY